MFDVMQVPGASTCLVNDRNLRRIYALGTMFQVERLGQIAPFPHFGTLQNWFSNCVCTGTEFCFRCLPMFYVIFMTLRSWTRPRGHITDFLLCKVRCRFYLDSSGARVIFPCRDGGFHRNIRNNLRFRGPSRLICLHSLIAYGKTCFCAAVAVVVWLSSLHVLQFWVSTCRTHRELLYCSGL